MSKASRGDGNPAELFQIQKDDAVEVLHAICQFSNLKNSAVATVVEKVFSLQSPQKSMPKNIQATTQLHSFHMPSMVMLKMYKLGFNSTWTENFQMYKLD